MCQVAFSSYLFLVALALSAGATQQPITTSSLLDEMVDLVAMAEFPEPPYSCKQFSSYDRASKSPDQNWFANDDRGQFLRVEQRNGRQEHVMMDVAGPGAIVRIWSANPTGTLRIYLDGAETPALEAPMDHLLGGKLPGIPTPIAGERSRGWNSYFPIPYAKHCQVTCDQGGFYYHVNYRTYQPGTAVETFRTGQLELLAPKIYGIAAKLAWPRRAGQANDLCLVAERVFYLHPGEEGLIRRDGPASIAGFEVRVKAQHQAGALRPPPAANELRR